MSRFAIREDNVMKSVGTGAKVSFGRTERVLAILFGVGFVLGFLLTPVGFETRSHELRNPVIPVFFIIVGLLLPLAGLIALFFRPKIAGILAIVDAALSFLIAPADQARVFFRISPPPAVTAGEYILILIGIGYMLYGQRIYLKHQTK
jgi:hypothetical protein